MIQASMNMHYRQLTLVQRYQIQGLHEAGHRQSVIAQQVGCHKSTISRELNRLTAGHYRAEAAHDQAICRRQYAAKATRQTPWLLKLVRQALVKGFSPAIIAHRLKLETGKKLVSHETLYRWIYADYQADGDLHQHLVRAYKPYRTRYGVYDRRGVILGRKPISERPAIVEKRRRQGDWEGDTVRGKRGHIVTLVDRASRYLTARKVLHCTRQAVTARVVVMLKGHPARTLTVDNGAEFKGHREIERRTKAAVYFAAPYHSWERGTNENTNGLLRRYLPKGTDFCKISAQQLRRYVERLNHRPRKCLGWKTPYEVRYGVSVAVIT
jgi:IS30 family transposase